LELKNRRFCGSERMALYFKNLKIKTHTGVYEPAEDSFLLAENLLVDTDDIALDIGTGTGIQALIAAEKAKEVIGVDINKRAIKLAEDNANLNKISNVEFRISDLFEKVSEKFDLIIFNPPYLPVSENDAIGKSWSGGKKGIEVIEGFLDSVGKYLKPSGRFQLVISSLNDINRINELFSKKGLEFKITASKKLPFEEIYVVVGEKLSLINI